MPKSSIPHPFLKWAGGKTQLIKPLLKYRPKDFKDYHEPFVGAGAFFFALRKEELIRRAWINDVNQELIDCYAAIRDHAEKVIRLLSRWKHDEDFYYKLRKLNPAKLALPRRAARMIYLNKTCYNGLYRVNSQGQFNVPFGSYKLPKYHDPENLHAVSKALENVNMTCGHFEQVLDVAKAGDLVYFDPPYQPLSSTSNFTSYHKTGFSQEDQIRLRDVCAELTHRKVKVMLSNSSAKPIFELYNGPEFFPPIKTRKA
jgi:DNA adenine methylase